MATTRPSSGYFFDVKEWNGSRAVQRMSFSEQGVYKAMLNYQWEKRSLPDDPQAVADLIASTPSQVEEVIAAWPNVRRKFVSSKGRSATIYNVKLERVRRLQRENRRNRQHAGREGGKAKSANASKQRELEASNARGLLESAVAKPSDLTRPDLTCSDLTRPEETRSKNSAALAARALASDGNLAVITKIAHEVIDTFPRAELGDLTEGIKERCSKAGILYPGDVVRRALDSAIRQRQVKAS